MPSTSPSIQDSTPNPTFAVQPTAVFAGTSSSLTLVLSVPTTGSAISFAPTDFISVVFPVQGGTATPLITSLAGVTPTTPPRPWSVVGPTRGQFTISVPTNTTLQPGDVLNFQFNSLPIVSALGSPTVTVSASIGGTVYPNALPVTVQDATPGIIAWGNPSILGLNSPALLQWSSAGGTWVNVSGYSTNIVPGGYRQFSVSITQTTVTPTIDIGSGGGSQHTYTAQLIAQGAGPIGSAQNVVFTLHQPFIAQFGFRDSSGNIVPKITIPFRSKVTVVWNCKFVDPTQGITISYNQTQSGNLPISEWTFDPSDGMPENANSVDIVLSAPGYGGPQTAVITVNYLPIRLLYFKFTSWTVVGGVNVFSGAAAAFDPPLGYSVTGSDQLYQLTATGPGGPIIQYLGTGNEAYVEIRYFSPSTPVVSGKPFTLQWFTNATTSLTLTTPTGNVPIASGQIAQGTAQFTLTAPFMFILSAQANSQSPPVLSYLLVTPTNS